LYDRSIRLKRRPQQTLPTNGSVQAAVVFDHQNRAFVADMTGTVQAFSQDHAPLWQAKVPGGVSATPVVDLSAGQLMVGTETGWVYSLDAQTGQTRWRHEVPTKSDPRILSDLLHLPEANIVVLNSWGGRYWALDASSGAERFSWDAGLAPYAGAAARAEAIYCLRAVAKQGVEFVRVGANGEAAVLHLVPEEKRGARRTQVSAMPVIDAEREVVYFVVNRDRGSLLHAWSLRNAAVLWQQPLPNSVQASPALRKDGFILIPDLAGGTAFVGDPLGMLHVIDHRGTGQPAFEAPRAIQGRPSFSPDGHLHLPCTGHEVYVFAPAPAEAAS
jgi:outer membrane protein assembly factor BamB